MITNLIESGSFAFFGQDTGNIRIDHLMAERFKASDVESDWPPLFVPLFTMESRQYFSVRTITKNNQSVKIL